MELIDFVLRETETNDNTKGKVDQYPDGDPSKLSHRGKSKR